MALTNAQYDEIMRDYQETQLKNRRITEERRAQAYAIAPRLKEIEREISGASVSQVRLRLMGSASETDLQQKLALLRQEKANLLTSLPFEPDYLEPVYTCRDCKDTGYLSDGSKCHCFRQAIINTVYSQSHIRSILERENFQTFSYRYYSDSNRNSVGLSALENMKRAVASCHFFIDHFDEKPKNLLLYGDTGVGKTFLSNCIAKELLDKGYSVIYFTAFQMFDILSKGVFDRDSDAMAAHQSIFDCDLLIIDDLGSELTNGFTSSQLFLCLNERLIRQKSTIISTNLGIGQLQNTYSERTFSRISSNYAMLKIFGEDIRHKKRME